MALETEVVLKTHDLLVAKHVFKLGNYIFALPPPNTHPLKQHCLELCGYHRQLAENQRGNGVYSCVFFLKKKQGKKLHTVSKIVYHFTVGIRY